MHFLSRRTEDDGVDLVARFSRDDMLSLLFDNYRGSLTDLLFVKVMDGMAEKFIEEFQKEILELIDPKELVQEISDKVVSAISERMVSAIANYQETYISGAPVDPDEVRKMVEDLQHGTDNRD